VSFRKGKEGVLLLSEHAWDASGGRRALSPEKKGNTG